MDPQTAITQGCQKAADGEILGALEHLLDYYHWRVKGGWQPAGGDRAAEQLGVVIQCKLEDLIYCRE